jgi:hypothetical protein
MQTESKTVEQYAADEKKRREEAEKAARDKLAEDRAAIDEQNAATQQAMDESVPTPTQAELDEMKLGTYDPDAPETKGKPAPAKRQSTAAADTRGGYQTRETR